MAAPAQLSEGLAKRYNQNPRSVIFARYASVLLQQEKVMEAISICQAGLGHLPDYLVGHLVLAKCFGEGARFEEAIAAYKSALAIDRRCPGALKSLGDLYRKLQNEDQAAAYYNAYLDVNPFDQEIRLLVDRYLEQGSFGFRPRGAQEVPISTREVEEIGVSQSSDASAMPDDVPDLTNSSSADSVDEVNEYEVAKDDEGSLFDKLQAESIDTSAPSKAVDTEVVAGDDVLATLDALETKEDVESPIEAAIEEINSVSEPEQPITETSAVEGNDILASFDALETDNAKEQDSVVITGDDVVSSIKEETSDYGILDQLQDDSVETIEPKSPETENESALIAGDDVFATLDSLGEEDHSTTDQETEKEESTRTIPTLESSDDELPVDDVLASLEELQNSSEQLGVSNESKSSTSYLSGFQNDGEDEPTVMLSEEDIEKAREELAVSQSEPSTAELSEYEDGQLPVHTAPSNVATVTLAELYFKQGLKDQAVDIYRKLLDREPDNTEIETRISDIEASIAADASPNQQSRRTDHRRPQRGGGLGFSKKRKR